jgi:hypothetical protein
VVERASSYRIEAELGQLHLPILDLSIGSQTIFGSGRDVLPQTCSREAYKTVCMRELLVFFPCDDTYRHCAQKLNRVLWREGREQAIGARTIANIVEREGSLIQAQLKQKAQEILNPPTEPSAPLSEQPEPVGQHDLTAGMLPAIRVQEALAELNAGQATSRHLRLEEISDRFEDPALLKANLSLDGVGCKHQKACGRSKGAAKKARRETVQHQVAHLQDGASHTYTFTAASLSDLLPEIHAFLLHNELLRQPGPLVCFLDGAPDLRLAIEKELTGLPVIILLDWYHLEKKCQERLSLALRGRAVKDPVLEDLLGWLWLGKVEQAIASLRALPTSSIKNPLELERLLTYLSRHQSEIPAYALRKHLGLRISSNPVEKANDLVVARRQKHNGMSWSVEGSTALAALTCLILNHQQRQWLLHQEVSFQFPPDAPPVAA